MRDISRIDNFCAALACEWKRLPDMRFGQFISNVMGYVVRDHGDIFFPEEEAMIRYIRDAVDEMLGVKK